MKKTFNDIKELLESKGYTVKDWVSEGVYYFTARHQEFADIEVGTDGITNVEEGREELVSMDERGGVITSEIGKKKLELS